MAATDTILEIHALTIRFHTRQGQVTAVDGLDLSVERGRVLGLVGESGCGKTVMSRSLLRIEAPGKIEAGQIRFVGGCGTEVALETLDPQGGAIRKIRWKEIAMIFQEPMSSFGPQHTIGAQIAEALALHGIARGHELWPAAVACLESVGMPRPEETARQYPYQLSGGMCQRAMIAMALSCSPTLLIADEPTTALDVATESQILELLRHRQAALGMSILYVTHPYTGALLRSIPRVDRDCAGPLQVLSGNLPEPFARPAGCSFHPRCPQRMAGICDQVAPVWQRLDDGSEVSCHLYREGAHG